MLGKIPVALRSLNVGALKEGFRWNVGNKHSLRDDDGNRFSVFITAIIREDIEGLPSKWLIYVKKEDYPEEGEFLMKVHREGDQSVTEEFEINI